MATLRLTRYVELRLPADGAGAERLRGVVRVRDGFAERAKLSGGLALSWSERELFGIPAGGAPRLRPSASLLRVIVQADPLRAVGR